MNSSIHHKIILSFDIQLKSLYSSDAYEYYYADPRNEGIDYVSDYCEEKIHLKIPKQVSPAIFVKKCLNKTKTCINLNRSCLSIPPSFFIPSIHFLKVVDRGDDSRGPEKIVIPAVFQVFIGHITQPQNLSSTCQNLKYSFKFFIGLMFLRVASQFDLNF